MRKKKFMELPIIKETAMQRSGLAYMIAKRVNQLQAQKAAALEEALNGLKVYGHRGLGGF